MESSTPFKALVQSLFPPTCLHCKAQIRLPEILCSRCDDELASCLIPVCEMPGVTPKARNVWGTWYYRLGSPIRSLHRALKYDANLRAGALIATRIQVPSQVSERVPESAVCIPIPSHRIRILERGLQQTTVLADAVASKLSIRAHSTALVRRSLSHSQSKLGRSGRLANLANAFEVVSPVLVGHALLVDDVMTTGATLDAAAEVLESQGIEVTLLVAAFRREAFSLPKTDPKVA
jgi:predicted amidophosphoribosyltransferase